MRVVCSGELLIDFVTAKSEATIQIFALNCCAFVCNP